MRTAFGRYSEELRVARGMTQKRFSDLTGMSLSRISNIENQRSNISDDVIRVYLRVLKCSGEEAHELRKLAIFSNGLRKRSGPENTHPPLQVMFEQFGDKISPQASAQIRRILERETGEQVEALTFSSNRVQKHRVTSQKLRRPSRPSLLPQRLCEIAMIAHKVRQRFCSDHEKLDIPFALQVMSVQEPDFDFRILETLPTFIDGAFACIIGHSDGRTLLLEEGRFEGAINGKQFARHVVAHEIGHYYLHAELLKSDTHVFLDPQPLAKNSMDMIDSDRQIEQIVDNIIEVEAECFATFLLVPWEAFIKGTDESYLANDFGEQRREVERYSRHFNNQAVIDQFKGWLWKNGNKQHPLFKLR